MFMSNRNTEFKTYHMGYDHTIILSIFSVNRVIKQGIFIIPLIIHVLMCTCAYVTKKIW